MRNKIPKEDDISDEAGDDSLSAFGEELVRKKPEMVRALADVRQSDKSLGRVADAMHDLFPFRWQRDDFNEGVRLCIQGLHKEAVEVLREALEKYPDAYPAHVLMGYALGSLGAFKEEVDCYRKAVKLKPDSAQIHYSLGVAWWHLGKNKKAFAAFKQALALLSDYDVAHYWLTFSFERLGRYSGSADPDSGREKSRSMAHAFYLLGNACVEHGLHSAARQAFKEAARFKPDFGNAYYQLGALHIKKLRNPGRAEKFLSKAEELFVRQNDLHRAALTRYLLRPEEVQEKASVAEEWLKEGLRLHRLGRYQGAVDAYRQAVSHKPQFPDAFYNMGIAYGSLEDGGVRKIDRAVSAFKETIRLKPDFIHAYTALGAAYLRQNEIEDAVAILREAENQEPDNAFVHYYLGIAWRMSSQLRLAADALKKAVTLNPDSAQASYALGMVYFDMMLYQEACQSLEDTLRIKPDFADAHYMLGILYKTQIGDAEKSQTHLKKAERLYVKLEDHQHAARVRQMLAEGS